MGHARFFPLQLVLSFLRIDATKDRLDADVKIVESIIFLVSVYLTRGCRVPVVPRRVRRHGWPEARAAKPLT